MTEPTIEAVEIEEDALNDVAGGGFLEPAITRKPITISKTRMPNFEANRSKFAAEDR